MKFKTLDVERDPVEQGFAEGAYDLVVSFFVIHATSDLERCLRNIRKLLKPGGFLVVGEGQEGQNGIASSGFIFGTLPGWWLGAESGRTLSPHVSPEEWGQLLRSTGFSGVDSKPPEVFEDVLNVFHFVSQAINEQVNFFREPLSPSSWNVPPINKLVIVGGQTARTSHLVKGLDAIFGGGDFATEIYSFKSLADVDYEVVDASSTVVSLTELDWPVFKDITEESFGALRKMFECGKTLLWVTSGRRDDEPYSNMTVGFGRTATHETPELRLQQLDIVEPQNTDPRTIADILLRFYGAVYKGDDIVWTVEPEIVIDDRQREMLSRLRPMTALNDRYNSARRPIVREIDTRESAITVQLSPSGPIIQQLSRYENQTLDHGKPESIDLHITHTVHSSLKTPLGYKFLALGIHSETGTSYVTLIPSLVSVINVPTKSAIRCPQILGLSDAQFLNMTAAHLVAMVVLHPLYSGQAVVAHNCPSLIAQALATQAVAKNVNMIYTTDFTDEGIPDTWIKLPQYLSQSEIDEMLLTANPSAFVGFSSNETQRSKNETTMISGLQDRCQTIMTAKTIYATSGHESSPASTAILGQLLRSALECVQENMRAECYAPLIKGSTIPLDEIARGVHPDNPLSIIDWTVASSLPVQITRLDTKPVFKSASTYWIVGMSGALGISLSDWMISKGAKYLVLTSRYPDVAPEWIVSHERKGAMVVVMPWFVSPESRSPLGRECL